MTVFLIFLGQNLKKIVITLQILRFKQKLRLQNVLGKVDYRRNRQCSFLSRFSLILPSSLGKKWEENRGEKKMCHKAPGRAACDPIVAALHAFDPAGSLLSQPAGTHARTSPRSTAYHDRSPLVGLGTRY